MKYLYRLFKKIILSFSLLYVYNIFMNQFNIPIPINIFTIGIITILGIPGFISLITFYLLNF